MVKIKDKIAFLRICTWLSEHKKSFLLQVNRNGSLIKKMSEEDLFRLYIRDTEYRGGSLDVEDMGKSICIQLNGSFTNDDRDKLLVECMTFIKIN